MQPTMWSSGELVHLQNAFVCCLHVAVSLFMEVATSTFALHCPDVVAASPACQTYDVSSLGV